MFAPPAWTILAFIIVKWHPNPWGVIGAGALGSVIGRYILTLYMPRLTGKMFRPWENDNIAFLGKKMGGRFWRANTFVLLYAISPLSTTALFTAAGMAKVNPWHVLPGFAVGTFLGDAWYSSPRKSRRTRPPSSCKAASPGKRPSPPSSACS